MLAFFVRIPPSSTIGHRTRSPAKVKPHPGYSLSHREQRRTDDAARHHCLQTGSQLIACGMQGIKRHFWQAFQDKPHLAVGRTQAGPHPLSPVPAPTRYFRIVTPLHPVPATLLSRVRLSLCQSARSPRQWPASAMPHKLYPAVFTFQEKKNENYP